MEKHFGSIHTLRALPESSLQQSSKGQQLPFLISGGRDSMLNFWTSTGDCMSSQAAHRGSVGFISEVNFDVPNLRAASANPTADTATGKSHMGFGCGNPLMISLGNDSVIKLWDVRRFKCVTEITPSDLPSTAPPPQRQQRPSKSRGGSALLNGTFTKAVWCPRSNNIGGDGGVSFVTGSSAGVVRIYEFNAAAAAATKAAAVAITTAAGAGGGGNPPGSAHQHHDSSSWVETDLASHTDGCSCSDLIVGERLVASSSRGGQILSWRW